MQTYLRVLLIVGLIGQSFSLPGVPQELNSEDPDKPRYAFGDLLTSDSSFGAPEWLDRIKIEMQAAFDRIKAVNDELQQRIVPARESVKAKVSAAGQRVVEGIRQTSTSNGAATSTSSFTKLIDDGTGPVGSTNVVTKTTSFNQHFP